MADSQNTEEKDANATQAKATASTTADPAQETDWKTEARKWEQRSKDNLAQVEQLKARLEGMEDTSTDLEKALGRISALEQHNTRLEHDALVAAVAAEKQVPASLLQGGTREELVAFADQLLEFRQAEPRKAAAPGLGHQPTNNAPVSDAHLLVRDIFK